MCYNRYITDKQGARLRRMLLLWTIQYIALVAQPHNIYGNIYLEGLHAYITRACYAYGNRQTAGCIGDTSLINRHAGATYRVINGDCAIAGRKRIQVF